MTAAASITDDLIGRAHELVVLAQSLAAHRFVTIAGPPGVGKTRLAEAWIAAQPAGARIVVCRLADRRTALELVADVACFLGTAPDGSLAFRSERVGHALRAAAPVVLVCDNFEQLEPACARIVAQWVRGTPGLSLLITSRHRLAVPEEQVLRLEPLAAPDATRLFRLLVNRVRPDLGASDLDLAPVVGACEGLPLALELAASRLSVLGLAALGTRMQPPGDVLRDVNGQRESRHGSLAQAFAWSWDLLPPWARDALADCAVFRGSFDLEAAEAVLDHAAGAPAALDALQLLVDRSLVAHRVMATRSRFELLAVIRELALERADPRAITTRRRHLELFARRAGDDPAGSAARDWGNLQVALEHADPGRPGPRAVIARALAQRLVNEGRFGEAVAVLESIALAELDPPLAFEIALLSCRAHGAAWQAERGLAASREAEALAERLDDDAYARMSLERSRIYWQDGDFGAASDHEVVALERLARARGSEPVMAVRAGHWLTLGLLGERERAYQALMPLVRATVRLDAPEIAGLAEMAGHNAYMLGRPARALEHFRDGSRRAARHGDAATSAWLDAFEAVVLASAGHIGLAAERMDEALSRLERFGRSWHLGHALHCAGDLALRLHQPERAEHLYARADALASAMPHPKLRALIAASRGLLAYLAGLFSEACALAELARLHLGERRDPEVRAWIASLGAVSRAALGATEPEHELALSSEQVARLGPSMTVERVALARGEVACFRGDEAGAARALSRALTMAPPGSVERPPAFCIIALWLHADVLDRRLGSASRRDAWADALDPDRGALLLEGAGVRVRPPGVAAWIDLGGRPKLVAVWQSLVASHRAGRLATVETLRADAWNGEAMSYEAGRNRVYAALSDLRRHGLEACIERADDGYRLAPGTRVIAIPARLDELAPPSLA